MAKRWSSLNPRTRRLILVGAAVEGVAKTLMLNDLRRRPAEQIRGPKWLWAATALVNSAGIGSLGYFVVGRRRSAG